MGSSKRLFNSLAARLTALIVVVAVPFVGLIVYDALDARDAAAAEAEQEAGYLAQALGDRVRGHLDQAREVSTTIAGVLSSGLLRPDDSLLARVLTRHPEMSALLATDSYGNVVASAPAVRGPTALDDRDYWAILRGGADFAIGSYTVGRVSGLATLPVAVSLRDEHGVTLGVVVAGVKLDALEAAVEPANRDSRDTYVIVDRNGIVLARSPNSDFELGRPVVEPGLRDQLAQRKRGTAVLSGSDGVARLYAFYFESVDSGIGVAAGVPQAVAYAQANRVVTRHGIALLGLALFLLVVGKVGVDALVRRPVRHLAAAAARLRDGDLSVRSGLTGGGGEIGQLADVFDDMAETLEDRKSELTRAEARYRTLVESSPYGIIVHQDGRSVFVNPAASRIAGAQAPADLVGRNVMDFVPPDSRDLVRSRHERVQRTGETTGPSEIRLYRVDGSVAEVEVVAIPVEFEGKPAISTILQDISARKQAERALDESQRRAGGAQRLEAVGRLAGGIAHDFNNLLTAVIGYAELGQARSSEDPDLGELFGEIRASADRAATLTRQLLAFSRQQPLQPRVVDLNVVTESVAGLLRRLIGEDVQLTLVPGEALWPVEVDPGQVEQVLTNLVINARDAMPNGGLVTVETANVDLDESYASAHPGADAGPHVMVAVRDTGDGIAPEIIPRIFEPFFTTKDPGKGTGLGLSTVYGIVKQSGGSVWVRSEVGRGATFEIYFPRVDKPTDWLPEGRTAARGGAGGGESILLVEDEPAVRALTARVLERAGYRVLMAGSPTEAVRAYEECEAFIHLLLTDVVLPEMSGKALAERLAERRGAHAPTLFMSGYTRDTIVHDGRLDPDVDFLEKPFTAQTLLEKVREVLDRPAEGQLDLPWGDPGPVG